MTKRSRHKRKKGIASVCVSVAQLDREREAKAEREARQAADAIKAAKLARHAKREANRAALHAKTKQPAAVVKLFPPTPPQRRLPASELRRMFYLE